MGGSGTRRYPEKYERWIPIALMLLLASTVFLAVASIVVILQGGG